MQCYTLATNNFFFFNQLKRNSVIPLPTFIFIWGEQQLGGYLKKFLLLDLDTECRAVGVTHFTEESPGVMVG